MKPKVPLEDQVTSVVRLYVTRKDKKRISALAKRRNLSMSSMIRKEILEAEVRSR